MAIVMTPNGKSRCRNCRLPRTTLAADASDTAPQHGTGYQRGYAKRPVLRSKDLAASYGHLADSDHVPGERENGRTFTRV
jgi:hypothetical protein